MNLATKLLGPNADLASLLAEFLQRLPAPATDAVSQEDWDKALIDPARDILKRSGKGVRARLLERAWHLAGGAPAGPPDMLPVLIELLHVGSLVIDDIEDDSPMRRGEPSLHRRFGVPVALNTGGWLYFLPLALLSRLDVAPPLRLALYEDMSLALLRCHQGQALDLSIKITEVRQPRVEGVVRHSTQLKTGSLMELAATLGSRAAGASPEMVSRFARMGSELGVGLQMLDDWSGVSGDARRAKGIEDIRLLRPTWPWAWLAGALDEVTFAELQRRAGEATDDGVIEDLLCDARSLLAHVAKTNIRNQLRDTLESLDAVAASPLHLSALRADVLELERAYG